MRESKTHWTPCRESNDFLNKYFLGKCTCDSDNGIITTLYSGSNGVCNPLYQLSSHVRLQNNFVELNLTRDESWHSGLQNPQQRLSSARKYFFLLFNIAVLHNLSSHWILPARWCLRYKSLSWDRVTEFWIQKESHLTHWNTFSLIIPWLSQIIPAIKHPRLPLRPMQPSERFHGIGKVFN